MAAVLKLVSARTEVETYGNYGNYGMNLLCWICHFALYSLIPSP